MSQAQGLLKFLMRTSLRMAFASGHGFTMRESGEAQERLRLLRISSTAATAFAARGFYWRNVFSQDRGLDEVVGRCTQTNLWALVKIDTEGAEAEILEGASHATLARIQQFIN